MCKGVGEVKIIAPLHAPLVYASNSSLVGSAKCFRKMDRLVEDIDRHHRAYGGNDK